MAKECVVYAQFNTPNCIATIEFDSYKVKYTALDCESMTWIYKQQKMVRAKFIVRFPYSANKSFN